MEGHFEERFRTITLQRVIPMHGTYAFLFSIELTSFFARILRGLLNQFRIKPEVYSMFCQF